MNGEKSMRRARAILAFILQFFGAEPVFCSHSKFVI
jgi:hypothetical protein